MAPSMSLFSRRKNSIPETRGIERGGGAGAAVTPTADIFPISPRLPKPRSRDAANPPPPSPKHLPRIRTTPVPHPEPVPRLSRSSSDVSLDQRHGPVYTAHPPPPPPGRYSNNSQPTPPTSASSAEAARKRPFRFPVGTLPISPPLSPESPLDNGAAAGNSLGMSPVYHSATPNLGAQEAPVRGSSLSPRNGRGGADEKQQHDALLQRIRELEAKNRELEADTTAHSSRITALRASHAAVVESLKEAHAVELAALRKNTHWPAIVEGKEKELELLRSNSDTLVARLTLLEQLLQERDRQVEWLREGRQLQAAEPQKDVDALLAEERKKSKEELAFVVQEEEKRRAELNWLFGEKIEKVEALRRTERAELEAQMEQLRREKEALEELQLFPKTTTGTDELMAMVKTLNSRLAEEKKKNKALEATMTQITDEAWFSVSDSKHSIQKLKHELEDKAAALTHLQREHDIAKRERAEFEDAWKRVCTESSMLQQSLDDRDERIRDLEEESGALRDALEQSRAELEQQQQQNDVHEDILVKLAQSSYSASSRESSRSPTNDESADLQQLVDQLRRDIKLYRSDIRAYKRDVKSRDKTIEALQSKLSSPVADDRLLKEFPAPPQQQRLKEENEALTTLVKQQARALEEMDEKMRLLQGEKELLVRRMQQGLRKVSGGRPRLPSVGEAAAPPPPPPKKSPPLPPQEEQGEVFVW